MRQMRLPRSSTPWRARAVSGLMTLMALLILSTTSYGQEVTRLQEGEAAPFAGVLVSEADFLEIANRLQAAQQDSVLLASYRDAYAFERELRLDAVAAAKEAVPDPSLLDQVLDTGTLAAALLLTIAYQNQ